LSCAVAFDARCDEVGRHGVVVVVVVVAAEGSAERAPPRRRDDRATRDEGGYIRALYSGGGERWPQSPPSPPNIMPCNCEVHGMHADTIKK
jgi:hypothetical protein